MSEFKDWKPIEGVPDYPFGPLGFALALGAILVPLAIIPVGLCIGLGWVVYNIYKKRPDKLKKPAKPKDIYQLWK